MREKFINFCFIFGAFLLGGGTMFVAINNFDKPVTVNNNGTNGTIQYMNYGIDDNVTYSKVTVVDNGIGDAVKKIYDAVVLIDNYQRNKKAGSGSGFVYKIDDKYGYIMTNHHVIENATEVKVTFSNDNEVEGTLLGSDEYLDIAIVRVDVKNVIKVAEIGQSEKTRLGDTIFTIGSPVGTEYFNSVTRGIVSGLDRLVTVSVNATNDWVMKVLQVDAAINPGNSGGPLVNSNGQVIGINSLKLVDNSIEGMGFAIKVEDAMAHVKTLESGQKIDRPLLGVNITNVTDSYTLIRYGISISNNITEGIAVISVVQGSGASKSDLQPGDVIIKIEDDKVTDTAYLKYVLYQYNVGDTVKVTYIRNGEERTTTITLTKNV